MKYIIVGAVAGGATTAARLRRLDEKAEIVIFEKGHYISYANCGLPYYIGDVIKDRNKLFVQTASGFATRFNIGVRADTEVTGITPTEKTVTATNLKTGEQYRERYDKLVLSPGQGLSCRHFPGDLYRAKCSGYRSYKAVPFAIKCAKSSGYRPGDG